MTRAVSAVLVALSVVAMPLVLDRCATDCAAHDTEATAAPACHHATPAATRIGHAPDVCGHDHSGTVVTSSAVDSWASRLHAPEVTLASFVTFSVPSAVAVGIPGDSPPGSPQTLSARSLPLRV